MSGQLCIVVILGISILESLGLCQQVSYQDGLLAALEKNDIKRCDRITEAIPLSDVGPSLATTRLTCKVQFGMARKDPNVCEQLANGPEMSARTLCYRRLAQSLRRPELCERISPKTASRNLTLTFRDQCRLQAIADPSQCTEGFHNTAADAVQSLKNREQCLWITARNSRNPSLCGLFDSDTARKSCLEDVNSRLIQEAELAPGQKPK